jgi:putative ABC transport system permease protein
MANHSYPVEVQSDFLEKITRAKPGQAIAAEATIGELAERNTSRDRFNLALLLVFAAGAMILGMSGVHSVTRETVAAKARELAIRVAIGANRRQLVVATTRQVALWVAVGTCAGTALVIVLGQLLQELLFEVSYRDGRILAGSMLLVAITAFVSALIPAWVATGRNPREQLMGN